MDSLYPRQVSLDGFVTVKYFREYEINTQGVVRNKLTGRCFTGGKIYYHLDGRRRRREEIMAEAFPQSKFPSKWLS